MTAELPPLMQEGGKDATPVNLPKWSWALCLIAYVARMTCVFSLPRPSTSREISYLSPSFPAFTIWWPIYSFQLLFVLAAWFQQRRASVLRDVAPWFVVIMLTSIYWYFCGLFLETTLESALVLSTTWACLAVAHGIVAGEMAFPEYFTMNVPITLQLGWGTAAMLVSWDSVVAANTSGPFAKAVSLFALLTVGLVVTSVLAMRRRSALLACTVAWAVYWVGDGTLNPYSQARLDEYNETFGEQGRIALGVTEMVLAGGLVAVGVMLWCKQPAAQA